MSKLSPIACLLILSAVSSQAATIAFDFTGIDPGSNAPWTSTSELDPNLNLTAGVNYGVLGNPGFSTGRGIDDAFAFGINSGSTEIDLAASIANDTYIGFTIEPASGYTLDLAGAEVGATLIRDNFHGPEDLYMMTSIEGFSVGSEVLSITGVSNGGSQNGTAFLPSTAAYSNLSGPVEIRYYFTGQQFFGKSGQIDNLSIDGVLIPEPTTATLLFVPALFLLRRRRVKA